MNLVEHHIIEVHSVELKPSEYSPEGYFVFVDLTVNCYGNEKRTTKAFYTVEEWEKTRAQGFFLG